MTYIGLPAISVAFGLYIITFVLEFYLFDIPGLEPAAEKHDPRSQYEVFTDFRRDGVDAVPLIKPSYYFSEIEGLRKPAAQQVIPLAGFANAFTIYGNELGYYITYVSDRFGFRNPDWVYDQHSQGPTLVILGDSYAQGCCVPEEHSVSGQLRQHGFNIYNFGISGNGPLTQLATWLEYGKHVKPDSIIWFFYEGNDLRNLVEESDTLLLRYLQPGFTQNLRKRIDETNRLHDETLTLALNKLRRAQTRQRKIQSSNPDLGEARSESLFLRTLRLENVRTLISIWSRRFFLRASEREKLALGMIDAEKRFNDNPTKYQNILRAIFSRIQNEAASSEIRLLVVYIPSYLTIYNQGIRNNPKLKPEDYRETVLQIFDSLQIDYLDFEKILLQRPDAHEVFFPRRFAHFNRTGYKVLAEQILKNLE